MYFLKVVKVSCICNRASLYQAYKATRFKVVWGSRMLIMHNRNASTSDCIVETVQDLSELSLSLR